MNFVPPIPGLIPPEPVADTSMQTQQPKLGEKTQMVPIPGTPGADKIAQSGLFGQTLAGGPLAGVGSLEGQSATEKKITVNTSGPVESPAGGFFNGKNKP